MQIEDEDVEQNKFFAVIAYISVLCFVPLLFKKSSHYAVFHGKQGLILFIWEVGALVVKFIPVIGWILWFVSAVACFVLAVLGMIYAYLGIPWRLPAFLGDWAEELEV